MILAILVPLYRGGGDYWRYNKIDPEFVEGAGTAPPEDVGGVTGFERFMEVISDPEDEEYQFMVDWAQGQKFKKYSESDIKGNLNIFL